MHFFDKELISDSAFTSTSNDIKASLPASAFVLKFTVWKNEKFTFTWKIFRENSLKCNLADLSLISQNVLRKKCRDESKFSQFPHCALCSRNFQNVKLRLDFVEILSFYRLSNFTWNTVFANSNGPKMSFLAILGLKSCSNSLKSKFRTSEMVKINIFGMFEFPKMWFQVKLEWR